jgi:hypothetical protein
MASGVSSRGALDMQMSLGHIPSNKLNKTVLFVKGRENTAIQSHQNIITVKSYQSLFGFVW